jgi:hypothetical protein
MNLKVRLPAIYLRSDFTPRFSLALTRKDVADALARGWAERDASIFLTLREERADTVVHQPESCTCLKRAIPRFDPKDTRASRMRRQSSRLNTASRQ